MPVPLSVSPCPSCCHCRLAQHLVICSTYAWLKQYAPAERTVNKHGQLSHFRRLLRQHFKRLVRSHSPGGVVVSRCQLVQPMIDGLLHRWLLNGIHRHSHSTHTHTHTHTSAFFRFHVFVTKFFQHQTQESNCMLQ